MQKNRASLLHIQPSLFGHEKMHFTHPHCKQSTATLTWRMSILQIEADALVVKTIGKSSGKCQKIR